jgi:alpha-L-arabinofuranosidase
VAREADWPKGKIGVGLWDTKAEFKDIKVTRAGKTLFESDFAKGMGKWKSLRGNWMAADGVLRKTGDDIEVRAESGDESWRDYTLSLKARKTSGKEGFIVFFNVSGEKEKASWNLGGWGNTVHVLDGTGVKRADKPGKIEAGRWYDIRIELNDLAIRCYLDNVLTQETTRTPPNPLYVVSGLKKTAKGQDLILKVVNIAGVPYDTAIDLRHAGQLASTGEALVLKADRVEAENSFENPRNVAPARTELTGLTPSFRHTFPPNSVTVLRVGVGR